MKALSGNPSMNRIIKQLLRDNDFLVIVEDLKKFKEHTLQQTAYADDKPPDWYRGRLSTVLEILAAIEAAKEYR